MRLNWSKIKVLFSSNSAREAIEVVKRLKLEGIKSDPARVFVRSSFLEKSE